jgi:tyramine---L-glutamate ligase
LRILLYEFVTGGGWHAHASVPPPATLAAEGSAMLRALAADFAAIDGVLVDVVRDARYRHLELPSCTIHEVTNADEERAALARISAAADWTLVIAPEFSGYLYQRCRAVEIAGGRLLGPGSQLVALTSDKQSTAEHLQRHGVGVPTGVALAPFARLPENFEYPAILKPRDGAGSQGIEPIACWRADRVNGTSPARLETYCRGTAASVAILCGPHRSMALPPCSQSLGGEGGFSYLGGSLPLPPNLANRATELATRALNGLTGRLGYLGVDLVLGREATGAEDVVIEINPRLTTSYVGLRALCDGNLAAAMLAIAAGRDVELCWKSGPIHFTAAGDLRRLPSGRPSDGSRWAALDRSTG